MAGPRIEALQKLEKFQNRRKMISIDLKNYTRKQENEHLIPTKELQKEQLNVLEKGINVVQNKTKKYWLGTGKKERKDLKDSMLAL